MKWGSQDFFEYWESRMKGVQTGPCSGYLLLHDNPPQHLVAPNAELLLSIVFPWADWVQRGSSWLGSLMKLLSSWLELEVSKSSTIHPRWRIHIVGSWCWLSAGSLAGIVPEGLSIYGLSMWLRLLTARRLESSSRCCKSQEVEAINLLKPEPWKWHRLRLSQHSPSVKQSWCPPRFKGGDIDLLRPLLLSGRSVRESVVTLGLPQTSEWGEFVFCLWMAVLDRYDLLSLRHMSLQGRKSHHRKKRVLF